MRIIRGTVVRSSTNYAAAVSHNSFSPQTRITATTAIFEKIIYGGTVVLLLPSKFSDCQVLTYCEPIINHHGLQGRYDLFFCRGQPHSLTHSRIIKHVAVVLVHENNLKLSEVKACFQPKAKRPEETQTNATDCSLLTHYEQ